MVTAMAMGVMAVMVAMAVMVVTAAMATAMGKRKKRTILKTWRVTH